MKASTNSRITLAIVVVCLLTTTAYALPPIAAEFYGLVLNNSMTNVTIEVRDSSGTQCGYAILHNESHYGLLSCRGDDPETPWDEGAEENETIAIFVNGTQWRTYGNITWSSAQFHEVNITFAEAPMLVNCSNASVYEDGNGSDIRIDLHACTYDSDSTLDQITYTIDNQSNSSLISCYIDVNRYVTCHNPAPDGFGYSTVLVRATDDALLYDRTNTTITVLPLPDAPRFLENWTHYNETENNLFTFQVNCSDPDGDELNYSTNSSAWPVNGTHGLMNFTLTQVHVGNTSINVTCSDGNLSSSQLLNVTVFDVNNAPVLDDIPNLIAVSGEEFTYDVNATDPDGDTLAFFDNTSLFSLDTSTGIITFTPTIDDIGLYTILIGVTDGQFNDTQEVNLRVVRGPYCGDGICSNGEDCLSCPTDCGPCPEGGTGGGGAGGAGDTSPSTSPSSSGGGGVPSGGGFVGVLCVEKWQCTPWGPCQPDGYEYRTCVDVNKCGSAFSMPETKRECTLPTCDDGIQNQGEEGIDCGGPCAPCPVFATCFDGIQNQGEEGIDCGGPCEPCFLKDMRVVPYLERPVEIVSYVRSYPWFFLVIALLLIAAQVIRDRVRIHNMKQQELEMYVKDLRSYIHTRRKWYLFALNTAGLLTISSLYVYYYSHDARLLLQRWWILATLYLLTPVAVSWLLYRLDMRDRRIQLEAQRALELAQLSDSQVSRLEHNALFELERLIAKQIVQSTLQKHQIKDKDLYAFIAQQYHDLIALHHVRNSLRTPQNVHRKYSIIHGVLARKKIWSQLRTYPEFSLVLQRLRRMHTQYAQRTEPVWEKIDFVDLMQDIEEDVHLQSVIASKKETTALFDEMRDLRELIRAELEDHKQKIKDIQKREMQYIKDFQRGRPEIEEKLSGNKHATRLHNLLVRLYNRYDKNMQLMTAPSKDNKNTSKTNKDTKSEEKQ